MNILISFFACILLVFANLSSEAQAGGGVEGETDTNTTNIDANTTVTASDLSGTYNNSSIAYPNSSGFSASSFSGYTTSFGSNCGLTLSGGYITNGNNNLYQLQASYNTNPCTNEKKLEEIRQNNETNREVIRANTQIINTCINARVQATQNNINPDIICKLSDFEMPRSP